jgi:AraC-like DNA-binding protein
MNLDKIRPESLHIHLFQYGSFQFGENGWVHKKRAPCTIIAQALSGEYEISTPRGHARTGEKGFFLAKAGEELTIVHHARSEKEKMSAHWLHIDYQFINGLDPVFFLDLPVVIKGKQATAFASVLKDIGLAYKNEIKKNLNNLVSQIKGGFEFLSLLESVSKPNQTLSEQMVHDTRLQKVFNYILQNLEKEIKPTELAKLSNLSLSHFHALFQELVGQTPMSYIKKMRINKAQKLLVMTNASVKEVAINLGFKNAYHFSREFSKELGVPPIEYRKVHSH